MNHTVEAYRKKLTEVDAENLALQKRVAELGAVIQRASETAMANHAAYERRVAELGAANAGLLQANRDCIAWFDAQQQDLEDCLKALGEIAAMPCCRPGTIDSAPGDLARETLAKLID
jgi:hypothetical protein